MWDEAELQSSGRVDPKDILAEIDAIDAPATADLERQDEEAASIGAPAVGAGGSSRLRPAIDAWLKRKAAYDADPNTYEAVLGRRTQEKNRKGWRAEYATHIEATEMRDVRDYERNQTPERRAEKKAAKSKQERNRRLAGSTPEQIEASKEAARLRAKLSRERAKQRRNSEATDLPPRMQDDPAFGRF